jgi:hypothetical protein
VTTSVHAAQAAGWTDEVREVVQCGIHLPLMQESGTIAVRPGWRLVSVQRQPFGVALVWEKEQGAGARPRSKEDGNHA